MRTIGNLNRRIKFATVTSGKDDVYGGAEKTYTLGSEVWADVDFLEPKSDEKVSGGQISAHTNTVFTIRSRDGITTKAKIVYEGLYYNILSILPQLGDMYTKIETVQIGNVRELGLYTDDGQNLQIGGGALILGPGADQSGNYSPPALIFVDGDSNEFTPT